MCFASLLLEEWFYLENVAIFFGPRLVLGQYSIFIYLVFYVAFNTVQIISQRVVGSIPSITTLILQLPNPTIDVWQHELFYSVVYIM